MVWPTREYVPNKVGYQHILSVMAWSKMPGAEIAWPRAEFFCPRAVGFDGPSSQLRGGLIYLLLIYV
jgi:hypothetical protein